MKIIPWTSFISGASHIEESVSITTGVFDGVHRGHQTLIGRMKSFPGTASVLSTFSSNPFSYFSPGRYPGDILSLRQKLEQLEHLGVDNLLLIDFSADFSKLSGRVFFRLLKERLSLRQVVLGKDHRCGYRGDTGAEDVRSMLEPQGITVDIVDPLVLGGHPVSSTRIREALTEGDLPRAQLLIGRPYSIDLRGIPAEYRGGRWIIRRRVINQIIPQSGSYHCLAGNEQAAVDAVLEIDDRTLHIWAETLGEPAFLQFPHKDDRKEQGEVEWH